MDFLIKFKEMHERYIQTDLKILQRICYLNNHFMKLYIGFIICLGY